MLKFRTDKFLAWRLQLAPSEHAVDAAQLQEKKMRAKNIVTFVSIACLSAFVFVACGKSNAPAEEAAHDHAGHDHAAEPAKAALAPEPAPVPEPKAEAAGGAIKNGFDGMPAPGTDAFCPVMKQDFKVAEDSTFSVHEGKTYVFCCPMCKPKFEADPKKFIGR